MINYYLLTKPGIIFGNLLTFAAGFLLASTQGFDFTLFLFTLLGLAFIIAAACVFNNYIDRNLDRKMQRTQNRPLAKGLISGSSALLFGFNLALLGNVLLWNFTNLLTLLTANLGFFIYVLLYSLWKGHTVYGTAIGSIAGAIPPVVGYTAVSNQLDLGAAILFVMLVLWQMPHFFAIALYRLDDYTAAGIPVLPVIKGLFRTQVHMLLYIIAFIVTTTLLTYFHYLGYLYLTVTLTLSLLWLALCLKGFKSLDPQLWGGQMFRFSLILITATCLAISIERI